MKYKFTFLLFVLVYFSFSIKAQKTYIDSSINKTKTDAAGHVIGKTSEKVNSGIDNLFSGNIFKKKNKSPKQDQDIASSNKVPSSSQSEAGKTDIIIANTDYASLSSLAEDLKSNRQVTNVEKQFSDGSGILKVSHTCPSDQLLDELVKDELMKKDGKKFDVVDISTGKISLKMK